MWRNSARHQISGKERSIYMELSEKKLEIYEKNNCGCFVKQPWINIPLPLRDRQNSAIIVLVFWCNFLERELDKYDDQCHSQASKAVLWLCSPSILSCSILYRQKWRSYACRKLYGGERLFVLNISDAPSIYLESKLYKDRRIILWHLLCRSSKRNCLERQFSIFRH